MKHSIFRFGLIVLMTSAAARADLTCESAGETEKTVLKTFELFESEPDEGFFPKKKVAVILKHKGKKTLLTGTKQTFGTRVGESTRYALKSEEGEGVDLTTSYRTLFQKCTRAGCPKSLFQVGHLLHGEETHVLSCVSTPL